MRASISRNLADRRGNYQKGSITLITTTLLLHIVMILAKSPRSPPMRIASLLCAPASWSATTSDRPTLALSIPTRLPLPPSAAPPPSRRPCGPPPAPPQPSPPLIWKTDPDTPCNRAQDAHSLKSTLFIAGLIGRQERPRSAAAVLSRPSSWDRCIARLQPGGTRAESESRSAIGHERTGSRRSSRPCTRVAALCPSSAAAHLLALTSPALRRSRHWQVVDRRGKAANAAGACRRSRSRSPVSCSSTPASTMAR